MLIGQFYDGKDVDRELPPDISSTLERKGLKPHFVYDEEEFADCLMNGEQWCVRGQNTQQPSTLDNFRLVLSALVVSA